MKTKIKVIPGGGITSPKGFRAAGVHCGIKQGKNQPLDLALIVSMMPAHAAAVFTSNLVKAAPVRVSQKHIAVKGRAQAIVANSGNANACTGEKGMKDALDMARLTAELLAVAPHEVLVASTGRIGRNLPMENVLNGIRAAEQQLSDEGGANAARAIMTSDKTPKEIAVTVTIDNREVTIGAIAKGAGMINPSLATMLCFITTDATFSNTGIEKALRTAVEQSFNCISVDNDTSTNDSVFLLANGMAGNLPLTLEHPDFPKFQDALNFVTLKMAQAIVKDGGGASKFVTVKVVGAASDADAKLVAKAIANSMLTKAAWCGGDANWGRILCAVGYSGAQVDPDKIDLYYDTLHVVAGGASNDV
ncbi:MAG: bifunctional glutamate N-acetyltransferase/amino-acid acetyltransferase ArgJ, partial [Verrucomicrobiae bacterium]|nr:bifunctional glutamate N-acetyltransferase/amino-acid acetyltransferase ArgJ [Verrucomicrobiae bacterium]